MNKYICEQEDEDEAEYESQAKGNSHRTSLSVDWSVVNSKEYRDKFNITGDTKIDGRIYKAAINILNHRNNTEFEDLYMIEAATGKTVYAKTDMAVPREVVIENRDEIVGRYVSDGLITVHNHPNGRPPSGSDLIILLMEKQTRVQVVVGHDGSVYQIWPLRKNLKKDLTKEGIREYYNKRNKEYIQIGMTEFQATLNTLKDLEAQKWVKIK
jgi:hypothetical protein